jgi:hypothetical protein
MGNVLKFPNRSKHERDQVTEIKESMVESDIFNTVLEVPTHLVIFILQYWQEIHDTGLAIGKTQALNMMLSSSSRLPMNKVEDLAKCRLQNELVAHAQKNKISPASLKASWNVHYSEGMWQLNLAVEEK